MYSYEFTPSAMARLFGHEETLTVTAMDNKSLAYFLSDPDTSHLFLNT